METTDETKVIDSQNPSLETQPSADNSWDADKYPSWQKSIGKEYWGNPKLQQFDSMKSVIESIVNPKTNAPEKYELSVSEDDSKEIVEAFKKADVSQEDAKAIEDAFGKFIPKKKTLESIKETYGDDFEDADKFVSKAIEKVCGTNDDLKKALSDVSIKNDPAFFEFARIVGKNLGDNAQLDLSKQEVVPDKKSEDPFINLLMKNFNK